MPENFFLNYVTDERMNAPSSMGAGRDSHGLNSLSDASHLGDSWRWEYN